jgi:hypothetical protein
VLKLSKLCLGGGDSKLIRVIRDFLLLSSELKSRFALLSDISDKLNDLALAFLSFCGLLGSLSLLSGLSLSHLSSLLLLDVLRDELFVLLLLSLGILVVGLFLLLEKTLSAESLFSDESLDLGCLVVCFLFFSFSILDSLLNLAVSNISAHIVLLFVKSEEFPDVIGSLHAEAVRSVDVGDLFDVLFTLLDHTKCDDGKIWPADASTD